MTTLEVAEKWADADTLRELILDLPLPVALFNVSGELLVQNDKCTQVCLDQKLTQQSLRNLVLQSHAKPENIAKAKIVRGKGIGILILESAEDQETLQLIEALNAEISKLEKLSSIDKLTGAWNRTQFDRIIDLELERSKKIEQPISLVILDIDHFKTINDTLGHQAGDRLLSDLSQRVASQIRAVDMLFRWGGEEFVVLAPSTGYKAATSVAERIRKDIAGRHFPDIGQITVSAGVAECLLDEPVEAWFKRADDALYKAKNGGRNRVETDRRSNSDTGSDHIPTAAVRLVWRSAYECGEPTIDEQHRLLFDLGNALFDATIEAEKNPQAFLAALEKVIAHLKQHFADEEAILAEHGYKDTHRHHVIHSALTARADEIEAAAKSGKASLGPLVEFLADTFISKHLVHEDKKFFYLFSENPTAET